MAPSLDEMPKAHGPTRARQRERYVRVVVFQRKAAGSAGFRRRAREYSGSPQASDDDELPAQNPGVIATAWLADEVDVALLTFLLGAIIVTFHLTAIHAGGNTWPEVAKVAHLEQARA
ncbi:MAG: hypothetical protein ACLPSH_19450 [Vulcanimicrobiaceae bacterium]